MNYFFIFSIIFATFLLSQDIEIVDDLGNSDTYPVEFLKQSEYFKGVLKAHYQPPLFIPTNISLSEMHNLYMDSLTNFQTSSLAQLTEYFITANKILNNTLQNVLTKMIIERLALDNSKAADIRKAREALQHILALDPNDIDARIILTATNMPNKTLTAADFQYFFKENFLYATIPESLQPSHIQTVAAISFERLIDQVLPIKGKIKLYKNLTNNKLSLNYFTFTSAVESENLTIKEFETKFNLPKNTIDWENTSLIAVNSDSKLNAFATPQFLVVTAIVDYFDERIITMEKFKKALIRAYTGKHYIPSGTLLRLNKPSVPCTHAAFSYDNTKLTYIKDNECFIIDIDNNQIQHVSIPTPIFSSILINNILLVRTLNGNTYSYNLETKKLIFIPNMQVDYFTHVYLNDNGTFTINGLSEDKETKEIEFKTDIIDLDY